MTKTEPFERLEALERAVVCTRRGGPCSHGRITAALRHKEEV